LLLLLLLLLLHDALIVDPGGLQRV
jgi:hypothetical protein